MLDITTIDWSKVKKSPLPQDAESDMIGYYRGSGIKISLFASEIVIADSGGMLITAVGFGDEQKFDTTAQVKDFAKGMLSKWAQDQQDQDDFAAAMVDVPATPTTDEEFAKLPVLDMDDVLNFHPDLPMVNDDTSTPISSAPVAVKERRPLVTKTPLARLHQRLTNRSKFRR